MQEPHIDCPLQEVADAGVTGCRNDGEVVEVMSVDVVPEVPANRSKRQKQSHRRPRISFGGRRKKKKAAAATSRPNRVEEDDEFEFVETFSYEEGQQPFTLSATRRALLLMDLHAHSSLNEVIGFLAGRVDAESAEVSVVDSFPCRSVVSDGQDPSFSVEMDPISEVETRAEIVNRGLEVVGWYHSHPTFAAEPSKRDMDNQLNYQTYFRQTRSATDKTRELFVAAIVGPYDTALPNVASAFVWFHASRRSSQSVPHLLTCSILDDADGWDMDDTETRANRCMVEVGVDNDGLPEPDKVWRQNRSSGAGLSYFEKMRASLRLTAGLDDEGAQECVERLMCEWRLLLDEHREKGSKT